MAIRLSNSCIYNCIKIRKRRREGRETEVLIDIDLGGHGSAWDGALGVAVLMTLIAMAAIDHRIPTL